MTIYRIFDTFQDAERYARTRRAGASMKMTGDGKYQVRTASAETMATCTATPERPRNRYHVACGEPVVCEECYSCADHCHAHVLDAYIEERQAETVTEQIEKGKRG